MQGGLIMLKQIIMSAFILSAIICGGASAFEFSADQVMRSSGMPAMNAKMYFADTKWRMSSMIEGIKSITIIRSDKNVSWILMPDQKMYMERKIDKKQKIAMSKNVPGEVKREKLGNETVNGINCEKFKVTYKDGSKTESVFIWMSKDKMPIKTAAIDNSWSSELKNIQKGTQDKSLFEVPAGFTKMVIPEMGNAAPKMDMEMLKKLGKM